MDKVGEARDLPVWERIDFLIGDSVAPEIVDRVRQVVMGRTVIVILDSDHDRAHVLRELRAYAPLVNVGSYVIVHYTNVTGAAEAVQEFLKEDRRFRIDRDRDRLVLTFHPSGYLQRTE